MWQCLDASRELQPIYPPQGGGLYPAFISTFTWYLPPHLATTGRSSKLYAIDLTNPNLSGQTLKSHRNPGGQRLPNFKPRKKQRLTNMSLNATVDLYPLVRYPHLHIEYFQLTLMVFRIQAAQQRTRRIPGLRQYYPSPAVLFVMWPYLRGIQKNPRDQSFYR